MQVIIAKTRTIKNNHHPHHYQVTKINTNNIPTNWPKHKQTRARTETKSKRDLSNLAPSPSRSCLGGASPPPANIKTSALDPICLSGFIALRCFPQIKFSALEPYPRVRTLASPATQNRRQIHARIRTTDGDNLSQRRSSFPTSIIFHHQTCIFLQTPLFSRGLWNENFAISRIVGPALSLIVRITLSYKTESVLSYCGH